MGGTIQLNREVLGPVDPGRLAKAAFRLVREHFRQAGLLWIGASTFTAANLVYRHHAGLDGPGDRDLQVRLSGYFVGLGPTLFAPPAIRLFLGQRRWWRIDRGYMECLVLFAAASLFAELPSVVRVEGLSPLPLLQFGLSEVVFSVLLIWMTCRLQLWPVGRLLEDGLTASGSWRLMQGAVWFLLVGLFLVNVPPAIPGTILFLTYRSTGGGWVYAVLAGFTLSLGGVLTWALMAGLYRIKVLGEQV